MNTTYDPINSCLSKTKKNTSSNAASKTIEQNLVKQVKKIYLSSKCKENGHLVYMKTTEIHKCE